MRRLKFGSNVAECKLSKYLNFQLDIFDEELTMDFLVRAPKKSRAQ